MKILETKRLILREYNLEDADFIRRLVNEPSWIENIGDRNVKSLEDAKNYIKEKLIANYKKYGFGLWMVELKDKTPIGMCGLVKRDPKEDPDIGFALLPEFWGKGYAAESSLGVLNYAKNNLKLKRILGVTIPKNTGSIKTLEKIGLKFFKTKKDNDGTILNVYEIKFQ